MSPVPPGPTSWRGTCTGSSATASPSCRASASTQGDVPDVMRGEEVQIFGAMRLAGLADGLFVLPGTHSKWAIVRGGQVTGFRTFMTGETYGLFAQHSILARTLDADAPLDEAAFRRGVARAGRRRGPAAQRLRRPRARPVRPSVARRSRRVISPAC